MTYIMVCTVKQTKCNKSCLQIKTDKRDFKFVFMKNASF